MIGVCRFLVSSDHDSVLVTEDVSKKTRQAQLQLRRFLTATRKDNPDKAIKAFLHYDRLYIDGDIFVYNQDIGAVELIRLITSCQNINFNCNHISPVKQQRRKSQGS